ncbi:hypothetical protein EXU85_25440 [Spirosoma sp. KCTC 42546]|uniref:hypothetical protein n=1 Tax=Spirosoma sp. KCTC 42546 TaxID=2520506 RepID=UPI00115B5864|nr:hypothetical protein [Spirosoma sp. KCTC 42546]QDK81773.1 hypothetical protein EXU85_25440 [Spirosoma sp. KCTC 42546]
MKITVLLSIMLTPLCFSAGVAQVRETKLSLTNTDGLIPINTKVFVETYLGKPSVRVVDLGSVMTEVSYAKIKNSRFQNGIIELELAGKLLSNAGELARGFVGIAFRIADDDSKFECIYLRPTNGRADDQVRRNHSVQYISYPGFPWQKNRKETPEKYESYVDLVEGEWTKVRIEIQGDKAKLYVHGAAQPTLIVNDLKHGPNQEGAIGLWVGPGTDAHFRDLVVTPKE